jgi:hypothetical protein
MGVDTRAAVDQAQVNTLRAIARVLRPGTRLRLTRTRPSWCAGWLEDITLEPGEGIGYVLEYVRDEYGGAMYRVEVLAAGDVSLYEAPLPIAGQPKDHGQPIDRAKWEGWQRRETRERVQPSHARGAADDGGQLNVVMQIAQLFLGQQRETQSAQLESVRAMVDRQTEQTTTLVNAVLERRDGEQQRGSFAAQLGEFAATTRAIDKVRKQVFGAAAGKPDDGKEELDPVVDEAKRAFVQHAMGTLFRPPAAAQAARAGGARPQQTPATAARSVPDAAQAGQNNGKPRN